MNKQVERIRAEIERLKGRCTAQIKANPGQTFPFVMEMTGYDKLLNFIDSLPEEPEVDLEKVVMIDNVIMNMTAEGYNNGYKTRPFYEEVLRMFNESRRTSNDK